MDAENVVVRFAVAAISGRRSGAFADFAEPGRAIRNHPRLDRFEITRSAGVLRKSIDSSGFRQRESQCAGQQVIAPEEILIAGFRQHATKNGNKAFDNGIKVARHALATPRRRVVHLGNQRAIVFPTATTSVRPLEHRTKEGGDGPFNRGLLAHCRLIGVKRRDAVVVQDLGAPQEYSIEYAVLRSEVVMQQRCIDPGALGDIADADAMKAMPGKQFFSRIQNSLAGLEALFGLRRLLSRRTGRCAARNASRQWSASCSAWKKGASRDP